MLHDIAVVRQSFSRNFERSLQCLLSFNAASAASCMTAWHDAGTKMYSKCSKKQVVHCQEHVQQLLAFVES